MTGFVTEIEISLVFRKKKHKQAMYCHRIMTKEIWLAVLRNDLANSNIMPLGWF